MKLLNGLGLDAEGLLNYAKSQAIRQELLDATAEAAQRYKVFGVPSMLVCTPHQTEDEAELYWGNDQILTVRNLLDGGKDYMHSAPESLLHFINNIPQKVPNIPAKSRSATNSDQPRAKL